jgi:hypothetical protein
MGIVNNSYSDITFITSSSSESSSQDNVEYISEIINDFGPLSFSKVNDYLNFTFGDSCLEHLTNPDLEKTIDNKTIRIMLPTVPGQL